MLLVTGSFTIARAAKISDDEATAVAAARGHFADLVVDTEGRVDAFDRAVTTTLRALTAPGREATSPIEVGFALERLDAAQLHGFVGAAMIDDSTPIALGIDPVAAQAIADLDLEHLPDQPRLVRLGGDLDQVVVMMDAPIAGTSAALFFEASDFAIGATNAWRFIGAELVPKADLVSVAVHHAPTSDVADERHLHTDLLGHTAIPAATASVNTSELFDPNDHGAEQILFDDQSRFVAHVDAELFGAHWHLHVASDAGFIQTPSSQEIPVLVVLSAILSIAVTAGLAHFRRARDEARQAIEAQEAKFAVGFEGSPIGVLELDDSFIVTKANRSARSLIDLDAPLVGTTLFDVVHPDSRADLRRLFEAGLEQTDVDAGEIETWAEDHEVELLGRADEGTRWAQVSVSPIRQADGTVSLLAQMLDVTAYRRARAEMRRRALHDELTGLPNRALLEDRLGHAIARSHRTGRHTAALFLDLDRFKQVNDSLGHRAGDELLCAVAERLNGACRATDTVARFGGDEFVVLCEELDSPDEATEVAQRIIEAMLRPVHISAQQTVVTVSIGIAVAAADDDAEAVLRDADLAMYEAKAAGQGQFVVFNADMRQALVTRIGYETHLRAAIHNGDVCAFYQPLYDLSSDTVTGFEALVRWQHPQEGVLAPIRFLDVADRLGVMGDIDRLVLRQACETSSRWSAAAGRQLTMAVNASSASITDPTYPQFVRECLDRSGLMARSLTIEVTEQQISGMAVATRIVNELRELGVQVALDDFGTGHSSFSKVAALAFDVLKIDRSLIADIETHRGGEIIRTVVEMARGFGVTTVAEGVESHDDIGRLRDFGSDFVQGYVIGRPEPEAVIAESLGFSTTDAR